jgi:hypothetical protein
MSKIYSRFDLPEAKPTECGDRMRDTYKWAKNEKGEKYLMHDADIDRQAEIESYADECDIKNIVARASFDPIFAQSLAQGSTGQYTDITDYPETIHELKRRADAAGKTIEEINEQLQKMQTEEPEEKPKEEVKNENEPE